MHSSQQKHNLYNSEHKNNIKTQTMCQIEGNLFFFNMVVLRYQIYNYYMPYLHKCIRYNVKNNKLSQPS